MFSIVIPLYNKEKYITRALQSVLNQTFQEFEIIIVDDGSTDNSAIEVNKFNDNRVRIISKENAGVASARNRGISEAKYDLIAFLDADDEWSEDFLKTISLMIKTYQSCDVFATSYIVSTKEIKTYYRAKGLDFLHDEGIIKDYFELASKNAPPLNSSAVVIRKCAIKKVGGFPVTVVSGEDLLTWARLASEFQIAYSKKHLSIYHNDVEKWEPGRPTDNEDLVGKELKKLLTSIGNGRKRSLRRYVGLWHKMRASTFLRHNQRLLTIKEACFSMYYNPFNYKTYIFLILAFMPSSFSKYIFNRV